MTLTASRLRKLLRYNKQTGMFFWRVNRGGHARKGVRAGCLDISGGYWVIVVDGTNYLAHRLAWLYVYGKWPKRLDHKSRCRSDNRIKNLRLATAAQNIHNSSACKNCRSPLKGAGWDDGDVRRKKWRARIRVKGAVIDLGRFEAPEEANSAYAAAARKYFGEFAHA